MERLLASDRTRTEVGTRRQRGGDGTDPGAEPLPAGASAVSPFASLTSAETSKSHSMCVPRNVCW